MTLPANWTLIPITATFLNRDGFPAVGYVTFESMQAVIIDGIVIVPKTITAHLDGNGQISVSVPSTNDPDLNVTGWAYTVTEHMDNGRPPYLLEVPYTIGAIDLATIPPAVNNPVDPVGSFLRTSDIGVIVSGDVTLRADLASSDAGKGSELLRYLAPVTGSVARTQEQNNLDTLSVMDFGAVGDGVAVDTTAINTASTAAVGARRTVHFPGGLYNFTFTQPPYNVTWDFDGTDITRAQLGGSGSSVHYLRPRLVYIDGPHATTQYHAEHVRAIAKGSNAIGAQFADYAFSLTIEKENWSESSGSPTAGEINGLSIFTRNGALTADPVKTGGAAILADIGQTADSGYTQAMEVVNSVFTKGTLAIEKQTNMQLLGIDERDNLSYGAIFNSNTGTQNSVIRASGTTAAPWVNVLEIFKDSINRFLVSDIGRTRWRSSTSVDIAQEQDDSTGDLVYKNNSGTEIFRVGQTRTTAIANAPRVQTTTTDTLTDSDHQRIVSEANAAAITVTLSATARAGTSIRVLQRDAGQVTFTPAAGATLRNRSTHTKTAGQWAMVSLEVAANAGSAAIWYLSGDTAA